MKKYIIVLGIYIAVAIIVSAALRWYHWHTSPWRKVPSSAWEQIAAQMRVGKRQNPLDAIMVLADVDAWLRG